MTATDQARRNSAREAFHSAESVEWFTPGIHVEPSRAVMGGIDLDPASCAKANLTVRAKHFFSAADDGLALDWYGKVFLNPPGGLVPQFWDRLVEQWRSPGSPANLPGAVEQAIWIGFSVQQLQSLQRRDRGRGPRRQLIPLDFPICFLESRISFVAGDGQSDSRPGHANYIAFLPPHHDDSSVHRFAEIFEPFGRVLLNGWDGE